MLNRSNNKYKVLSKKITKPKAFYENAHHIIIVLIKPQNASYKLLKSTFTFQVISCLKEIQSKNGKINYLSCRKICLQSLFGSGKILEKSWKKNGKRKNRK